MWETGFLLRSFQTLVDVGNLVVFNTPVPLHLQQMEACVEPFTSTPQLPSPTPRSLRWSHSLSRQRPSKEGCATCISLPATNTQRGLACLLCKS